MLHGIVALCPRTGSLLWSKAYASSFGLPPPPGGPMDAHNLASLVFALQLNAAAALSDSADADGGAGAHAPALRSVDMGPGLRLVFYRDPELPGLMLALSLDPALGSCAERRLAESICTTFAAAFGEQLRRPPGAAAGHVRRLRGATELVQQALASVSRSLLDELLHTFSDRGVVLWGHAMQPDVADLPASAQALGDLSELPAPVPGLKAMPSEGDTLEHRFDAVGSAAAHQGGVDSPGCGSKRKAPEKLLSKCAKVPWLLPPLHDMLHAAVVPHRQ
jgi:hypothetical protein